LNGLTKIYWLRVALGAIAGLISAAVTFAAKAVTGASIGDLNTLLNGITIALFVYLLTYYILRAKFRSQVEKQSKIMTMGIFIYFFTWLVVWVLTLSILIGPYVAPVAI
jgi:uncharacterized membrane-anchored protein